MVKSTEAALTLAAVAEHILVWSSYSYEVVEQEVEGVVDSNHQGEVEVQVELLLEATHVHVVHENVEGIPAIKVY